MTTRSRLHHTSLAIAVLCCAWAAALPANAAAACVGATLGIETVDASRALRHRHGQGVAQDFHHAVRLYTTACRDGSALSCLELSYLMTGHSLPADTESRPFELIERACSLHLAKGCTDLGDAYVRGEGGPARDEARAAPLLADACDGGDPNGCTSLGLLFEQGRGVPLDLHAAFDAFQDGCTGGAASKGGLPPDMAKTLSLFDRACKLGEAIACFNLANYYAEGLRVPLDRARAAELYRTACERGYQPACSKTERQPPSR